MNSFDNQIQHATQVIQLSQCFVVFQMFKPFLRNFVYKLKVSSFSVQFLSVYPDSKAYIFYLVDCFDIQVHVLQGDDYVAVEKRVQCEFFEHIGVYNLIPLEYIAE